MALPPSTDRYFRKCTQVTACSFKWQWYVFQRSEREYIEIVTLPAWTRYPRWNRKDYGYAFQMFKVDRCEFKSVRISTHLNQSFCLRYECKIQNPNPEQPLNPKRLLNLTWLGSVEASPSTLALILTTSKSP